MTLEALWHRYAAIWSMGPLQRGPELEACLAEDVTYCDPNGLINGREGLSEYMSQFQRGVPGGRFQIGAVLHHHGRTLAQWTLHGADGNVLQTGTSFAALDTNGRLRNITGFFHPGKQT